MRGGNALIAAVVTVTLLLTPVAGGAAMTQENVALTVTVVDTDGETVAGAELTATWDGGSTTQTTASNGKAFIDVPKGADVTVETSHPDYVRNFPYVVENASEQDVTIEVAPKGQATISVKTPQGAAVDGARVTVSRDGRTVASGRTGSGGTFQTGVIEQREYRVHVVKPGYVSNSTSLTVGSSTKTTLATHQESVLLEVTVKDDHFSPAKLVENVTVSVGNVGTVRAANGKGAVSVPVNDNYEVSLRKEGYAPAGYRIDVGESPKSVTLVINREPALSVEPANKRVVVGETVRVTVTDEYSEPVANATVFVNGEERAETGTDGVGSVVIEQPGENAVVAKKGGIASEAVNVTGVSAGTATETPTATETGTAAETTTTSRFGPGFGALPALAALAMLGAALLARRDR